MRKILFIYNADSDLKSRLLDQGKKYISPSTYQCRLCAVSYGVFGTMKRDWKKFVASLDIEPEFLHKDELSQRYPYISVALPAILEIDQDDERNFNVLVSSQEFESIANLEQLKTLLRSKLSAKA